MSFFFQFARTLALPASQAPEALHYRFAAINDWNIHTRLRSLFFFLRAMTNVLISKDFSRSCLPRTRIGCFPYETALGMFVLMAK